MSRNSVKGGWNDLAGQRGAGALQPRSARMLLLTTAGALLQAMEYAARDISEKSRKA